MAPFHDPAQGRVFRHFGENTLTLSSRTCKEWLQLTFQLKWALGEKNDVFTKKVHTSILRALLAFEAMFVAMRAPMFTTSSLLLLEDLIADYFEKSVAAFGEASPFELNFKKPKNHAYSHALASAREFGAFQNACTFHFEKAHTVTKDAACRTNNKSQQEATMMRRIIKGTHLQAAFDQHSYQAQQANPQQLDEDRATAASLHLIPSQVTAAWGLYSEAQAKCRHLSAPLCVQLLDKLRTYSGTFVTVEQVKLHAALVRSSTLPDGTKVTELKVHCRDQWQQDQADESHAGRTGRYTRQRVCPICISSCSAAALALPSRLVSGIRLQAHMRITCGNSAYIRIQMRIHTLGCRVRSFIILQGSVYWLINLLEDVNTDGAHLMMCFMMLHVSCCTHAGMTTCWCSARTTHSAMPIWRLSCRITSNR